MAVKSNPLTKPTLKEKGETVHRTKWALGFVMMVFGLLLTTQFRVVRQTPVDPGKRRADELALELKASEEALKASEVQRAKLETELDQLRKAGSQAAPAPPRDISGLELLAGTTEVQGPGLIVSLVESTEGTATVNRISDEDLWRVVNELLAAGAEAVAINGHRLTSITGIRNVGSRILVNNAMVSSPLEVQAIGSPAVLEASLKLRGGVAEFLEKWGIKVTMRRSESIRIPPVRVPPSFLYAKPVSKP